MELDEIPLVDLECGTVAEEHKDELDLAPDFDESQLERWLLVIMGYHMDTTTLAQFLSDSLSSCNIDQFQSIVTLVHVFMQLNIKKLMENDLSLHDTLVVEPTTKFPKFDEVVKNVKGTFSLTPQHFATLEEIAKKNNIKTFEDLFQLINDARSHIDGERLDVNKLNEYIRTNASEEPPSTTEEEEKGDNLDDLPKYLIISETKTFYEA
ncbi:MAG: hypothetical protein EBS86_17665, partial [Crocinitomicaceae bacterium]|nr:hypothetical protein [Crocinitomicaceae bacterium]